MEMIDISSNNHRAIVFISGSAGELDWVLPILDYLLKKDYKINIIFLSRHARKSVKENRMCNDFIYRENSKIDVVLCGSYFFEKIERFVYLTYRVFLKLELDKKAIINKIYNLFDSMFKNLFFSYLPPHVLEFEKEKCLFISEYPSLRRPRDRWIRQKFEHSIFFYCPHSPHIYAEKLERKYSEPDFIDLNKNYFLLLGHPGDYFVINDEKELAAPNLEKVFIGHPKFSDNWLKYLRDKAKDFRSISSKRDKINILVLSRGFGSYLNEESHNNLVETTINVVHNKISKYNLFIKKHPREIPSHWDNILGSNTSIKIVNDHILQLATKADFVISFWGSGAMDCFSLGVPVIEYWNPNKHQKQQIFEKNTYTTIYRKLGIVTSANDENELRKAIDDLMKRNYKIGPHQLHPFYSEIMIRSNQWDRKIKKILSSHNLIGK